MAYYLTKIERINTSKEDFDKVCEIIKTEYAKYKLCSLRTTVHDAYDDYFFDNHDRYRRRDMLVYTVEFVTEKELSFNDKLALSQLNLYQVKRTFKKISNLRYKLFYQM